MFPLQAGEFIDVTGTQRSTRFPCKCPAALMRACLGVLGPPRSGEPASGSDSAWLVPREGAEGQQCLLHVPLVGAPVQSCGCLSPRRTVALLMAAALPSREVDTPGRSNRERQGPHAPAPGLAQLLPLSYPHVTLPAGGRHAE